MRLHQVRTWLGMSIRRVFGGSDIGIKRLGRARQTLRNDVPACEVLEDRVVLTTWGGTSLLGNLSAVGVVTGPIVFNAQPQAVLASPTATATLTGAQLGTAWKVLFSEFQTLASKSAVTIADLESLTSDSQAIAQAGFQFSAQSVHNVISELATAVAGGTSTGQAQSDLTSLFAGSSVSSSVINSTFDDLVKAIEDSNVTTTDLSTVASDEAAIDNNLTTVAGSSAEPAFTLGGNVPIVVNSSSGDGVTLNPDPAIVIGPPIGVGTPILPGPYGANSLLGSLSHVGVVTGPVVGIQAVSPAVGTASSAASQLQTDIQALRTELQTLAAKSGVTVADLESLTLDGQAIAQAGFSITSASLGHVISELTTAIAAGTSTGQAQSDFNALFTGSSVPASAITNTFTDLVKTINHSNVTTTDLSTVASDEAAIQTDLKNLQSGNSGGGTTGGGGTGSPPILPIVPGKPEGPGGQGKAGAHQHKKSTPTTAHHHTARASVHASIHIKAKAISRRAKG